MSKLWDFNLDCFNLESGPENLIEFLHEEEQFISEQYWKTPQDKDNAYNDLEETKKVLWDEYYRLHPEETDRR
jgi:hypothetical protein